MVHWGFAFDDLRCDAGEFSTRPHEFLRMAGETQCAWSCRGTGWSTPRSSWRSRTSAEACATAPPGGEPTPALLENANGTEVPGSAVDSPPSHALAEMTILIASWDDDLHFRVKESQAEQNLVDVLTHQYRGRREHGGRPTVPVPRAEATWTSDPCDISAEPLPIPAIRWWWDEL